MTLERGCEMTTATREALMHDVLGDAERTGDGLGRLLLEVEQDKRLTVRSRHASERVVDQTLYLTLTDRIERRPIDGDEIGVYGFVTRAAASLVREVARDPAQPRTERIGVAKPREVAPRSDERLLRDVIGERALASRGVRDGVDHVRASPDELRERIAVATTACHDQVAFGRIAHVAGEYRQLAIPDRQS